MSGGQCNCRSVYVIVAQYTLEVRKVREPQCSGDMLDFEHHVLRLAMLGFPAFHSPLHRSELVVVLSGIELLERFKEGRGFQARFTFEHRQQIGFPMPIQRVFASLPISWSPPLRSMSAILDATGGAR